MSLTEPYHKDRHDKGKTYAQMLKEAVESGQIAPEDAKPVHGAYLSASKGAKKAKHIANEF